MSLPTRATAFARGRRRAVIASLLAVVIATLGVATSAIGVTTTPYNINLIKNRGFEAGSVSANGQTSVNVPGWSISPGGTVVAYGTAGGFPTVAQGADASGGNQFYTTGRRTDHGCDGYAYQYINIRNRDADIDAGAVALIVSARIGTYADQPDTALVDVKILGGTSSQSYTLERTATAGKLELAPHVMILLPGTDQIIIELHSQFAVGYCDAYFDNISVKLVHV
jgi:hypothetical protein